ncbi:MFS transporter [Blastococcus sp. SYSU D00669]
MRRPSTQSIWRDGDFRLFWTGHSVSQLGAAVTQVALPLVALLTLEASAAEVGLLRAAEFLPYLLLTLPAGALVDRVRRRPLMIGCDLWRAAWLLLVPLAAWVGGLSLPLLLLVTAAAGAATVLFDVAYLSVLPSLVRREQVVPANAALETSRSVAGVAGPSLAGALVGVLRPAGVLLVDAAGYVVSAVALALVRRPEPRPEPRDPGAARGWRAAGVGLRQLRASPVLGPVTVHMAAANLSGTAFETVFLVFLVRDLGLGAAAVGLVLGLGNLGLVLGAATSAPLARRLGIGPVLVLGAAGSVAGLAVLALTPAGPAAVPLLIAGQVLFTTAILWFNVQSVSLRQTLTPSAVLGRVNAAVRLIGFGTIPLGAAAGGLAGDVLGLRETLLWCLLLSTLALVPLLRRAVLRTRTAPEPEPLATSPCPPR